MALKTSNTGRFNQIMNSRIRVGNEHVGQVLRMSITSATYSFYDEANGMMKDIYNLNAAKATVVDSPWFRETYAKALALETAGDTDAARVLFDELLNKSTVTASIINSNGLAPQFNKDEIVNVPIIAVESKEGRAGIGTGKIYGIKVMAIQKGGFKFDTEIEVPAPKAETVPGSAVTA